MRGVLVTALLGAIAARAAAQSPTPAPAPAPATAPAPAPAPAADPAQAPADGGGAKPPVLPERPPPKVPKFDWGDGPPPFATPAGLGYPVMFEPKALGYLTILPVVRVGRDGLFGTRIDADSDLGLENYEVTSPAMAGEIRTDFWGFRNVIRLTYSDSDYHGARALRAPLTFDSTTFAAGTVLATTLSVQRVDIQVAQQILRQETGGSALWLTFSASHTIVYTALHDPAAGRRESNRFEAPLILPGLRVEWAALRWLTPYAEGEGMGWRLEGGRTFCARGAAGIEIRFAAGWGLSLEYTVSWFEAVRGGPNREEARVVAYGPRLLLLAQL